MSNVRRLLPALIAASSWACGSSDDPTTALTGLGADGGRGTVPGTIPGTDGGASTPPSSSSPPPPLTNDAGQTVCERRNVDAYGSGPEMMIVLDRSTSMTIYGRWQPSVDAVKGITRDFERLLSFGLTMFPGPGGGMCSAGVLDVPSAPLNAMPIAAALGMTQPQGYTPTGAALEFAATTLGDRNLQLDQTRGRPAFVLLVTDGDPSCQGIPPIPGLPAMPDTAQQQAAVDAVKHLRALNIPTYVFGYQIDANFQALMNQLAMEGGTDHYYPAESAADITAAFRAITKDVVRCTFELSEDADPTRVDVRIDGQSVNLDPANGWVIDKRTVTLVGQSCDTIKDGKGHALDLEVACESLR